MPLPVKEDSVHRGLLRVVVTEKIRSAILEGTLTPGERLVEDDLIEWLGVSRTPVREAIGELSRSGLIETTVNRSARVARHNPEETVHVIHTLGYLFGGVVREVVTRASDAELAHITSELMPVIEAIEDGKLQSVARTASEIYESWLEACANSVLVRMVRSGLDGLAYALRADNLPEVTGTAEIGSALRDLVEAMRIRDARAAEHAMRRAHQVA